MSLVTIDGKQLILTAPQPEPLSEAKLMCDEEFCSKITPITSFLKEYAFLKNIKDDCTVFQSPHLSHQFNNLITSRLAESETDASFNVEEWAANILKDEESPTQINWIKHFVEMELLTNGCFLKPFFNFIHIEEQSKSSHNALMRKLITSRTNSMDQSDFSEMNSFFNGGGISAPQRFVG